MDKLQRQKYERKYPINKDSARPKIANALRLKHQRILQNITEVSAEFLQNQEQHKQQLLNEGHKLAAFLYSDELAQKQLTQFYCHKTGRPLHKLQIADIEKLLQVHGKLRTLHLLQIQHTNQTATEWLATDSEALSNLAKVDPIGYFIYSAGLIYSPQAFEKSGVTSAPHDNFSSITMTNFCDSHELIDQSFEVKLASVKDKAIAHQQLQQIDINLIRQFNELLRRLFSLISPFQLLKHSLFKTGQSLAYWTASVGNLQEFRELLIEILHLLVSKKIKERINKTDIRYISYAEICEMQQKHGGLAAFRLQERKKAKTSVDPEIMLLLRDFVIDNLQMTDLQDLAIAETSAEEQKQTKIALTQGVKPIINQSAKFKQTAQQATQATQPTKKPTLAELLKRGTSK